MDIVLIGAVALIACTAFWGVRKKSMGPEVLILVGVLLVNATASLVIYYVGGVTIRSGSTRTLYCSAQDAILAAKLMVAGAVVVTLVATVCAGFVARPSEERVATSFFEAIEEFLTESIQRVLLAVCILTLVLNFIANGELLMSRDTYQFVESGTLGAFFNILVFPSGVVGVVVARVTRASIYRRLGWLIFLTACAAEFSRASRTLALLAMIATLVVALSPRVGTVRRIATIGAGSFAAATLINLVIQLRGTSRIGYGLVPFLERLREGEVSFSAETYRVVMNNLIATTPITAQSSRQALPDGFLSTSLTPVPGRWTDWYEMAPSLVLGFALPTNAVGQAGALGLSGFLMVWISLGLMVALPGVLRSGMSGRLSATTMPVCALLAALGSVQLLQYSVRTGSRVLWLALAVSLAIWFLGNLQGRTHRTRGVGATSDWGD